MAVSHAARTADISRSALFDELAKIAEEKSQPGGVSKALQAMGVGALGGAAGYGGAELLARKLRYFNSPPSSPEVLDKRVRAARIILPILSGAAVMLADRYRQKMNEQYSTVEGYKGPK